MKGGRASGMLPILAGLGALAFLACGGGADISGGSPSPPADYWAKTLAGNDDNALFLVVPTSGGKLLLGGLTRYSGAGGTDVWLVRTRLDGTVEGQFAFGGAGEDKVSDLRATADGGCIFAGSTTSFGAIAQQGWVVKLDGALNVQWEKRYPPEPGNATSVFSAVVPVGQHYAVLGYQFTGQTNKTFLLDLNADGSLNGQVGLNGPGPDAPGFTRVASACAAPDQGVLLVGDADAMAAPFYRGAWYARIAPDLKTVLWSRWIGANTSSATASVIRPTSDGGFILAGQSPAPLGSSDPWMVKITSEGAVAWQTGIGGAAVGRALDVQELPDHHFQMLGATNSFGAGDFNLWLIDVNPAGTVQWQKALGTSSREGTVGAAFTLDAATGAAYLVADRTPLGTSNIDAWFLKVGPGGTCPPFDSVTNGTPYTTASVPEALDLATTTLGSGLTATSLARTPTTSRSD